MFGDKLIPDKLPFGFADRELTELERQAAMILIYESIGRPAEALEIKTLIARQNRGFKADAIAVCLIVWVKATNEIVGGILGDDLEHDYEFSRRMAARSPSDHNRCMLWCVSLVRSVLTSDTDKFTALVRQLGDVTNPGIWIETMLSSMAELAGDAIEFLQRQRGGKARFN